jgi:hypothetical protein
MPLCKKKFEFNFDYENFKMDEMPPKFVDVLFVLGKIWGQIAFPQGDASSWGCLVLGTICPGGISSCRRFILGWLHPGTLHSGTLHLGMLHQGTQLTLSENVNLLTIVYKFLLLPDTRTDCHQSFWKKRQTAFPVLMEIGNIIIQGGRDKSGKSLWL